MFSIQHATQGITTTIKSTKKTTKLSYSHYKAKCSEKTAGSAGEFADDWTTVRAVSVERWTMNEGVRLLEG